MAISDAKAGRLITTLPIGRGVDAARFDDQRQLAFASNGDGTITVIHEDAPDKFTVVATVQTKRGTLVAYEAHVRTGPRLRSGRTASHSPIRSENPR